MSSKDKFLTRSEFCLLVAAMSDGLEQVDVPTPAIVKVEWGKACDKVAPT